MYIFIMVMLLGIVCVVEVVLDLIVGEEGVECCVCFDWYIVVWSVYV